MARKRRPAVDIHTGRICLALLDRQTLSALANGRPTRKFSTPVWWPDEADRLHVKLWLERAESADPPPILWGPRGIVLDGRLIGHAGFHRPPTTIEDALSDPSYNGPVDRASGGVVEIGYTVFRQHQGNGYACEAATALVEWARSTGEVSTVLATVAPSNRSSKSVLDGVGGFQLIGNSVGDDGQALEVFRRDL